LALAPTFREDFRESLYRMVGTLTGSGVTVLMTVEVAESFADLRFSADLISFLTDDVIFRRYVEIEGRMHKVMTVIKMRGSTQSKDLRLYDVTAHGLEVGNMLYEYRGIITGVAQRHQAAESTDSTEHDAIILPPGNDSTVLHAVGSPPTCSPSYVGPGGGDYRSTDSTSQAGRVASKCVGQRDIGHRVRDCTSDASTLDYCTGNHGAPSAAG
jgi:hypothetical protein